MSVTRREEQALRLLETPAFAHVRHRTTAIRHIIRSDRIGKSALELLIGHFGTWCSICRAPAAIGVFYEMPLCRRCWRSALRNQNDSGDLDLDCAAFIAWSIEHKRYRQPTAPVGERPRRDREQLNLGPVRSRPVTQRCQQLELLRQVHVYRRELRHRRMFFRLAIHRLRLPDAQQEIMLLMLAREEMEGYRARIDQVLGPLRFSADFFTLVDQGLLLPGGRVNDRRLRPAAPRFFYTQTRTLSTIANRKLEYAG